MAKCSRSSQRCAVWRSCDGRDDPTLKTSFGVLTKGEPRKPEPACLRACSRTCGLYSTPKLHSPILLAILLHTKLPPNNHPSKTSINLSQGSPNPIGEADKQTNKQPTDQATNTTHYQTLRCRKERSYHANSRFKLTTKQTWVSCGLKVLVESAQVSRQQKFDKKKHVNRANSHLQVAAWSSTRTAFAEPRGGSPSVA